MRRVKRAVMISGIAATMLAAFSAAAVASAPAPTTIAHSLEGGAPVIFVDSRHTVNVLWTATVSGGYPTVRYAREPAGAKHFTTVALPGMPYTLGNPFIYEPSPGTLEVVVTVDGPENLDAWTSTNDGASWTNLPSTPLETWSADGLYLQADTLYPSPGGPLAYAGSDGDTGPIVQLNSSLSQATTVATDINGIIVRGLGRTATGTVFVLGTPADASSPTPVVLPYQAGTNTGQLTFPCAEGSSPAGTSYAMAVGRSLAVVAFAGCGHVWTRTISAGGTVGALVSIGSAPAAYASGEGTNGSAWVGLVAATDGTFTAAYTVPGDDLGVSHSSDGSHWRAAAGLVPVQGANPIYGTSGRSLSQGAGTWSGLSPQASDQSYLMQLMPLSQTYRPPAAPSTHGIAHPRRATLGSMAIAAPGAVAKAGFEKTGKATVKVLDALGGTVTAGISVFYVQGQATYDVCSGSTVARLSPGRAKAVAIPCANGAIVIGGVVSTLPVVKKGYQVTFTFTGRNGTITVSSRIS